MAEFWRYVSDLKSKERRGWKDLGLDRVESVADHSLAVALLAMFETERRGYDAGTVLKMALIHDLEESIIGDLTPRDKKKLGEPEVRRQKGEAITELINRLPIKSRRSYLGLWTDLRLLRTREARLVHDLDKLEMALQARAYARKVGPRKVADFFRSAADEIKDPALRDVLKSLKHGC
jgi:putative hydrolases of HD superfamily